jgi:hypothetical protein
MLKSDTKFRNVIACDDVREEVRNKKSLMGVFSGDIVVAEIPANIWISFYIEKMPEQPNTSEEVAIQVKQNDKTIGNVTLKFEAPEVATLVLGRAMMRVPEECTLSLVATVNGGESEEILSKLLKKGDIQPS